MNEKCYSLDNDNFGYTKLEDAIQDKLHTYEFMVVGTKFVIYEADAVPCKAGDYLNKQILCTMLDNSCDDCGDNYDWLICSDGQEKELIRNLTDVINNWADKHSLQPTWSRVENVKEIDVEVIDIEGNYKINE